jgi:hypothetical protein
LNRRRGGANERRADERVDDKECDGQSARERARLRKGVDIHFVASDKFDTSVSRQTVRL